MRLDGSPLACEFSFAPADRNAGKQEADEDRIFVTCSGLRFRCVPHKVERLFCALSDRDNTHVMEGTLCVLTDRFMAMFQQNGTYIVKTDQGAYADLHCLKKSGRMKIDDYPRPVGAYQKNLECEQITVSCAREVNGKECAKSLPLAHLPDHQSKDCFPAAENPAAEKRVKPKIISYSGQGIAGSTSGGDGLADELGIQGLLTAIEALQLNQMLRSQEVTLIEAMPEKSLSIARQIAMACDSEPFSRDGTLCWKIVDYSRRKQQADTGELPILASQPFFTGTGYKLCAKVYLAGDGVGNDPADKGRFSVGVAIMQSDNDNNLQWPFKENVMISLQDQSNKEGAKDIVKSVVGMDNSYNCKKPETVMNAGLGFPDFLEGKDMARFIADDSLVIRIKVESLPERKHIRGKRRLPTAAGQAAARAMPDP